VDPDAEVQGEICLAVQVLEDARGRSLRCHVRQARYVSMAMVPAGIPGSPQLLGVRDSLTPETSGLTQDPRMLKQPRGCEGDKSQKNIVTCNRGPDTQDDGQTDKCRVNSSDCN
jgi:hypothetical protein